MKITAASGATLGMAIEHDCKNERHESATTWNLLPYFITAEMKSFTSASGVLLLFIHDSTTRSRSCL